MARLERQEMNFESYVLTFGPYGVGEFSGAVELPVHVFDRETAVDQILVSNGTASTANQTMQVRKSVAGETLSGASTNRDTEEGASNYTNYVMYPVDLDTDLADGGSLDTESVVGFDGTGTTAPTTTGQMPQAGAHFDKGDGIWLDVSGAATNLAGLFISLRCRERIIE